MDIKAIAYEQDFLKDIIHSHTEHVYEIFIPQYNIIVNGFDPNKMEYIFECDNARLKNETMLGDTVLHSSDATNIREITVTTEFAEQCKNIINLQKIISAMKTNINSDYAALFDKKN